MDCRQSENWDMTRMTVNAKVGPDGTLSVTLPMDAAGRDVRVTIEPTAPGTGVSRAEWESWVSSMAGTWEGDFERMPQGDYEERELLS
jgi:hypothetical protein